MKLHKQIIRKFIRIKVYSSITEKIWGVDLTNMQSLSKFKKEASVFCARLICLVNIHGLFP